MVDKFVATITSLAKLYDRTSEMKIIDLRPTYLDEAKLKLSYVEKKKDLDNQQGMYSLIYSNQHEITTIY